MLIVVVMFELLPAWRINFFIESFIRNQLKVRLCLQTVIIAENAIYC